MVDGGVPFLLSHGWLSLLVAFSVGVEIFVNFGSLPVRLVTDDARCMVAEWYYLFVVMIESFMSMFEPVVRFPDEADLFSMETLPMARHMYIALHCGGPSPRYSKVR